jgi:hypothetical protein
VLQSRSNNVQIFVLRYGLSILVFVLRTLRELARSYQTIGKDLTRVMNLQKALYRGWGIACAGTQVYAPRYREEWLNKISQAGVRRRAELLYQQLDGLQALRREVRPELWSG